MIQTLYPLEYLAAHEKMARWIGCRGKLITDRTGIWPTESGIFQIDTFNYISSHFYPSLVCSDL